MDSLNSLFRSMLVNVILNISNSDTVHSKAVYPLSLPLYHGSLLHQEVLGMIPISTLVDRYIERNTLFLEPYFVIAFFKFAYLDIVDTLLVSWVLDQLSLFKLVLNVDTIVELKQLEISILELFVLEGELD